MYSINLTKITLDEFERTMTTSYLLPSERMILNDISLNIRKFKDRGYKNIKELQNLLKNKKNYDSISADFEVDKEYLKILNRMVNSFNVKSAGIEKLDIFTDSELKSLYSEGIKTNEILYETLKDDNKIKLISIKTGIPAEKLEYALHIADLVRINGVGVGYAKSLYDVGIKSVNDYNKAPSQTILDRISSHNREIVHSKATLGISDIDYCRRFTEKLDCDILK
jgi:hypothetical protein